MKIKIVLVIAMLLFTLNVRSQIVMQKHTPITYIEKYDSVATELMNEYKIPVSVILGISMLESGYGTSKLSVNKNNYFGVKKGKYYRGYDSDSASFKDFCEIISRKKFYETLKNDQTADYKIWINKIRSIGYSTSTTWSNKVFYYIKKYKLYEYDRPKI